MRLRKFRVRAYRCIHDSGEITVGDLAAFVGRNESGKTTILQALTLLNRDEIISDLDLCDEMSEELKEEIRLAEGEFELNDYETEILKRFDNKIRDPRGASKGKNVSKIIKDFLKIKCPINKAANELNKFFKKNNINLIVDQKYFPTSKNKISKLFKEHFI